MNLKQYLSDLPRGSVALFARSLEVSASYLSQLASGEAPISPLRSVQIERASDGAVRRWDLRPTDWHDIWPELVTAEGAPPVQERPANLPSGEPQKVGRKDRAANDPVAFRAAQEG